MFTGLKNGESLCLGININIIAYEYFSGAEKLVNLDGGNLFVTVII